MNVHPFRIKYPGTEDYEIWDELDYSGMPMYTSRKKAEIFTDPYLVLLAADEPGEMEIEFLAEDEYMHWLGEVTAPTLLPMLYKFAKWNKSHIIKLWRPNAHSFTLETCQDFQGNSQ
jgi:hypothetical protein